MCTLQKKEIERKFLVRVDGDAFIPEKVAKIEQIYVQGLTSTTSTSSLVGIGSATEVRVRKRTLFAVNGEQVKEDPQYTLTIKKESQDAEEACSLVREETETQFTTSEGEALWNTLLKLHTPLKKIRFYAGQYEFDSFYQVFKEAAKESPIIRNFCLLAQNDIYLAEIELAEEDDRLPMLPRGITSITEVTHDPAYRNINIAKALCTLKQQ